MGYQRAVRDVACLIVTVPGHHELPVEVEELAAAVVVLDKQRRVFDPPSPFMASSQHLLGRDELAKLELGGDHVEQGLEDFFLWLLALRNYWDFGAYMFSESMLSFE